MPIVLPDRLPVNEGVPTSHASPSCDWGMSRPRGPNRPVAYVSPVQPPPAVGGGSLCLTREPLEGAGGRQGRRGMLRQLARQATSTLIVDGVVLQTGAMQGSDETI